MSWPAEKPQMNGQAATGSEVDADLIDEVVIIDESGTHELSLAQFFALPLALRVSCLIQRTATFYSHGREIDRKEAVKYLRRRLATG